MTKKEMKKLCDGSLTLRGLIVYNEKVFLPMLEKKFAGKKEFNEFKKEMTDFKEDMLAFKTTSLEFQKNTISFIKEMKEFRNIMITNQDTILKKLDILLGENKVQNFQEKKRKKMCRVMVGAAAKHNVITPRQVGQIERLETL